MEITELCFNDGTVVVMAEEKIFRLHAGLLAARSQAFQAVLENKNEVNHLGIELSLDISGLPLLELQDAAHDAHNFFLAIYDPGFFEAPPMEVSLNCVLGILKMSTKYQVQALRRRALTHLTLMFPLSLNNWDNRTNLSTISIRREAFTSMSFGSAFEGTLAVVKIGKTFNAPWIIPAALYECCTYDPDYILSHPTWDNGAMDDEIKLAIILGAFKHRDATQSVLRFLATPPSDECQQREKCLDAKRNCINVYVEAFPTNNPLSIWDDGDWDAFLDGLCAPCNESCKQLHKDARFNIWKGLPEMYGLKPWSVLGELYQIEMSL